MVKKNKIMKKVKIFVFIILGIILSAGVGAGSILLIFKYNPDLYTKTVTNINKSEKEVTVTDKGISDAVDKLYDATVIVKVGSSESNIQGWGSGVVYKTDDHYGYILTNHHVVEDMNYVQIVFSNKSEVEGTIVGSDQYADIAVVKVPLKSVIAVAEIGSSDDLRVGDTVFAIGTPIQLTYSFTVTRGILSGKDRMVATTSSKNGSIYDAWYMNLLQIDASINSGNSGGPLANSNGLVVGINNSKLSSNSYNSSSIENIGFSIPIEVALNIAEQLISDGSVTRPLLGVTLGTVETASQNGIELDDSITYGAVIVDVQEGSAAAKAGLKKGDVIIKMDDYKIDNYMYLKYYLYRHKVGDTIKVNYIRGSSEHSVEVKLSN